MHLTVSSVWVIYEIIVLIWTEFLSRKLALWEKLLLVLLGVGVAIYGGYSEHKDSIAMSSLTQTVADTQTQLKDAKGQLASLSKGQEFNKGQLDVISKIDAKTLALLANKTNTMPTSGANAVANAAAVKIDALQSQLAAIQQGMAWRLTDSQRAALNKALSTEKPQTFEIQCIVGNTLSLMFAKDLASVFNAHGWQGNISTNVTINGTVEGVWIGLPQAKDAKIINGLPDKLTQTPQAAKMAKILTLAGIKVSFGFDGTLPSGTDWRVTIGIKPTST